MTEPVIVPRAEHPISRRDIDSDALKVLYRLHESGAVAYLVILFGDFEGAQFIYFRF